MKAGLRFGIAAAATLIAMLHAPAAAQDPLAPTTNAPASDTIGPRELQNFNLNGTVTRPAETPPPAQSTAPEPNRPARTTTSETAIRSEPAEAPSRAPAVAPRSTESARPERSVPVTLPPSEALSDAPSASAADAPETDSSLQAPVVQPTSLPEGHSNVLPWLLALLAAAGGAGYYFWRQRSEPSYAAAGAASRFVAPEPTPAPGPSPEFKPVGIPAPKPAAAKHSGVVSTRLRPWLDIEFTPSRCVVEEDKATIDFDVIITNSGSTPARDVLIEASLFNAGPSQDQEIGGFFEHPVAKGDRIPAIPPMRKVAVKSAVSLTLAQMRQFEVQGRRIFVPLIGFNALYKWSGGDGQTSNSYLLGRETKGEKLAPFRLDLGPRIFRGLGARQHSLSVRN